MVYNKLKNTIIFPNVTENDSYDLEKTFNCGQCFRWDKSDKGWQGFAGKYSCCIYSKEKDIYVESFTDIDDYDEFAEYMYHYLALDMDYVQIKKRFSEDETMKKAIEFADGIHVLNQPFFETLITFIISQNNNIPRIKKIVDSMAKTFGSKVGDMYAFPTSNQLKDITIEQYNELKMGFRSKYVFDAVEKINNGEIDFEKIKDMEYSEAQKYLIKIKGVGPKVADCVLLFSCEKYESFPKDVWINRALEQMFPNGLPECIKGLEGIAQQYIFHYARFNLEK